MSDLRDKAKELASAPYTVVTVRDETTDGDPVFVMYHPELPGCMAQGITVEEARVNLEDARREYILSLLEDGLEVPVPLTRVTNTVGTAPNISEWPEREPSAGQEQDARQVQASSGQQLGTVSPIAP